MSTPDPLVVGALSDVLYPPASRHLHVHWRKLVGTAAFAHPEGLSHQERVHRSYRLLHEVNESLADVEGFAADAEQLAAMHEWTAPVDGGLTTVAGIHYNLFLGSVLDLAPDRDLTEFIDLRRTGTFLCTELAHGNNAARLETTATHDPATGGFVLHTPHRGAAKFMPNTGPEGGAKSGLVAARLLVDGEDHGVHLFLVPLRDDQGLRPGVSVEALPETLTSPVDHCVTGFDQVRLPASALLGAFPSGRSAGTGRQRFLRAIGRVTPGKLCMSACGVGVAKTAVTIAMRHAHSRHTADLTPGSTVTLFEHRAHQTRLIDAVATTYAATALHRYAVRRWVEATPEDRPEAERLVAITKGWTTWRGRAVAIECRERCGARGVFRAGGFGDPMANLEGTITAEGDNLVIWAKAAGELALGWRPPADSPAPQDMADPGHLRRLLVGIERSWQRRAARRLRDRAAPSPLSRWNNAVNPALELVDAHAHRLAADALLAMADEASRPARALLRDVHRLFALRRIAAHDGLLLTAGLLTAEQADTLPDLIDDTIADLAPHALALVEAFGVPVAGLPH